MKNCVAKKKKKGGDMAGFVIQWTSLVLGIDFFSVSSITLLPSALAKIFVGTKQFDADTTGLMLLLLLSFICLLCFIGFEVWESWKCLIVRSFHDQSQFMNVKNYHLSWSSAFLYGMFKYN